MREGEEMADERRGRGDEQGHEGIGHLRKDDDGGHQHQLNDDESLVVHTDADLVLIAVAQEMDHAQDAEQEHEADGDKMMEIEEPEGEEGPDIEDVGEMLSQHRDLSGEEIVAAQKPIGQDEPQDRGEERAAAESQDVGGHQYPEERHQPQQLHPEDAADAEHGVGIEDHPHGPLVLIGLEEEEIEGGDSQGGHAGGQLRPQIDRHCHEHDEGAGDHTTVDADKGIDIVEQRHHQHGKGRHTHLEPPPAGDDSSD